MPLGMSGSVSGTPACFIERSITDVSGRARELGIVFAAIMGPLVAFGLMITLVILVGQAFD